MSKQKKQQHLSLHKLYSNAKLNCILKILLNNDELTSWAQKIKTFHTIETKWGIRNCCQARILALCAHTERVRESIFKIHVQCSNQCLNILRFFQHLSHSIQSNKTVINFILEISLLVQYLDKNEKKTPPLIFDSPPF